MNLVHDDIRKAAEANGKIVDEMLETIARTAAKDRTDYPAEYSPAS